MSILSTQVLASKYPFFTKKNQFFGEIRDSRSGIRKAQNAPRTPCYARKEVFEGDEPTSKGRMPAHRGSPWPTQDT